MLQGTGGRRISEEEWRMIDLVISSAHPQSMPRLEICSIALVRNYCTYSPSHPEYKFIDTTTELAIANGLSPPVHSEPLVMPHHRRVQSWWP